MPRWPGQGPFRYPRRYGSYSQRFPTRYFWRRKTRRMCRRIVNRFPAASVNSYTKHPPPTARWSRQSFDVWGRRGRGWSLPPKAGRRVWKYLWFNGNYWSWGIYRNRHWGRYKGWSRAPAGPPGSDAAHMHHIHLTET